MAANLAALSKALGSSDVAIRAAAAEQLAHLAEEAQPAAVELVEACDAPAEVREWANAALEGLGPPAIADLDRLTALLNSESLDVAYWAATLLGRLGTDGTKAVPALERLAKDSPHETVRRRAAQALAKIRAA